MPQKMKKNCSKKLTLCVGVWYLLCIVSVGDTQLLINVKNQGGDVLQETITANVTDDVVLLEFQRSDGTLITQLVDFKNEVQILKALVLGEEERGQSQYQVMCFVCHFQKGEFISSDAMSKLRQKNPGTIRIPEEDRGRENFTMDLFVELDKSSVISRHVGNMCSEAGDATYARESDLKLWASQKAGDIPLLIGAVKRFPPAPAPRCSESTDPWKPCLCHFEICIGWYPCGLKYCKGKDNSGKVVSYRCGIKTCKKCRLFEYYVKQKQLCLWDE